jgi:carbon-monoxide dehydrogenase medium subunit
MYPKAIESYFAPASVDEALRLIGEHPEARFIAGGQSLMPMLKLRLLEPNCLIDLNRISGLSDIREMERSISVGAMVRHSEIASNGLVERILPLVHDAARVIGDPQIRNRGTIGGSLAHADPAADYPTAVLALGGQIIVARPDGGKRVIEARQFVTGPLSTALAPGELITEVVLPKPAPRSGGAYLKHALVSGDFAVISVAAQLTVDASGRCSSASVVIGGLPAGPAHAHGVSEILVGTTLDPATLGRAADRAEQGAEVGSDARASAAYRRNLIRNYVPVAIQRARLRAEG